VTPTPSPCTGAAPPTPAVPSASTEDVGLAAASAAILSIVTMPITAMWFLLLAPFAGIIGGTAAIVARTPSTKDDIVSTTDSLAIGLRAGPLAYVTPAAVV
jgi:hypothetical protein